MTKSAVGQNATTGDASDQEAPRDFPTTDRKLPPVVARPAGTVLRLHPLARLFPVMAGPDGDELARDIAENGLREAITTVGDEIVDGANRYRACRDRDLPFTTQEWDGEGSLLGFVVRKNLYRRQLSASQRSIVAAELAKLMAEESAVSGRAEGDDGRVANLPAASGRLRDRAAQLTNVSPRSVGSGTKVLDQGVCELAEMVRRDEVAVSAAAAVAELPQEQQRHVVAGGPAAVREVSKRKRVRNSGGAEHNNPTFAEKRAVAKEVHPQDDSAAPESAADTAREGAGEDVFTDPGHATSIPDSALFALDARFARRLRAILGAERTTLQRALLDRGLSLERSAVFSALDRFLAVADAKLWRRCTCCRTGRAPVPSCGACRGRGYVIEPASADAAGTIAESVSAESGHRGAADAAPVPAHQPLLPRRATRRSARDHVRPDPVATAAGES